MGTGRPYSAVKTICGIILGGASCTGKSHVLAETHGFDPALAAFEMDELGYSKPHIETHLLEDLEWLRTELQLHEIQADVEASSPKVQICKISLLKLVVGGQRFITTCGYLPRPDAHFYDLIETALGAELFHVLVNPSIATHVYWICRRGRFFHIAKFCRVQRQNTQVPWDATIRTATDLGEWMKESSLES